MSDNSNRIPLALLSRINMNEMPALKLLNGSRLYCYAQKHVKSIRAVTKLPDTSMAKSFRAKSTRNKPPKPQTKTKPTSPYHVSDHKAAITVGVIMGVFLICWVPFFCVNIVAAYCKTCISVRAFQVRHYHILFSPRITPACDIRFGAHAITYCRAT